MNRRVLTTIAAGCLSCVGAAALAAEEPCAIRIAAFKGDKPAAVSFTFDDGSQNQVDIALPIFDEFGIKATFYVVPGLTRDRKDDPLPRGARRSRQGGVSWEEWQAVAEEGDEIGNHSLDHARLTAVRNPDRLRCEVFDSSGLIAAKIGQPPLTFAYPYYKANSRVRAMVLEDHIAAREQGTPYGGMFFTAAKANSYIDHAIRKRTWLIPVLHGVEEGYAPIKRETLRKHLQYVKEREAELWIDTFANVSRYRFEREQAEIRVESRDGNVARFTVACSLDPEAFNVPLTVIVQPQVGRASSATATREGGKAPLPVTVEQGMILVDVVPGPKPVTVQW